MTATNRALGGRRVTTPQEHIEWDIVREGRPATLEVSALSPLSNADKAEIEPEALALLRMHAPQANARDVAFGPLSRWTR